VKWTEDAIRTEAAKYDSKVAFYRGTRGAYRVAYKRGLLDELFGENLHQHWTEEAIRAEAAKYDSKVAFQRGSGGAYQTALSRFPGLIDELFGENVRWTEEKIRTEAPKYDSKIAFQRGSGSAYKAARKRFPGLLDELFNNHYRYTDADVFYIWKVKGKPVVKIGITSKRVGIQRINICAINNKVEIEELHLFETEHSKTIEKLLHQSYRHIPKGFSDGKTEFRTVTPNSYKKMIETIQPFGTLIDSKRF